MEDFAKRGLKAHAFLSLNFEGQGETTVRASLEPFISAFRRLSLPDVHVFICHASEDKDVVRMLAEFITEQGASVWLDERDIKVGDSIVAKINEGIGSASHLVVVLSKHSAASHGWPRNCRPRLCDSLGSARFLCCPSGSMTRRYRPFLLTFDTQIVVATCNAGSMSCLRPYCDTQRIPNFTFDRTAGSHALAAAGQRGRSPHGRRDQ